MIALIVTFNLSLMAMARMPAMHFLKDRELHSDTLDARRWKETALCHTARTATSNGVVLQRLLRTLEAGKVLGRESV